MGDVFSNAPPEDDEDATPGLRVAGALTGDGEDAPEEEESPQAKQPQGTVDGAAQSYLTPAGADDGETGPPQADGNDTPVSADTKAYMTPIAPPTLAKPAAFADHSGTQAQMVAQKTAESQENVKPSVGRKILAALSAGAAGFGSRNSEVGARIGQEILNGPRTDAQARWAQQEAPIQARLNADQAADAATTRANAVTEQQNRLAETNYSNQIRGQQDAARADNYNAQAEQRNAQPNAEGWKADDPKNPLGGYSATTIGGKTVHSATAPASVQNTADYKIADAEAKGHSFTPEQQQILRGGGKLTFRPPPNPRQPSAEEISLGQARAAFIKENGRPPQTLDEQNQVTQAAKGTLGGAGSPATPETAIQQHLADKESYMSGLERQDDGSYVDRKSGDPVTPQQVAARLEKFRSDLNNSYVMRKSGTQIDAQGNTVTNRFSRNPQTGPGQQQSPAATQQPAAPKPPRTPAAGLPENTAARNPRTGQVEWIVKGGQWTLSKP